MIRPFALVVLLAACRAETAREDSIRAPSAVAGTASSAPTTAADSAPARPACPADGSWSACAVVERLERAGLVPIRDSGTAAEPAISAPGFLLRLGNARLEVYLYGSASDRVRAMRRVDSTRYLGYMEPVSMQQLPTLIQSANLVAILHSRNDHQRERVSDLITAGPPQPSSKKP